MNDKWFLSSTGSGDLSLTLKGLLLSLVPFVTVAYKHYGYELPQADIEQAIVIVSGIASSVMMLVGLIRKIYYAVKSPQ